MSLCAITFVAVLPFGFYRLALNQWVIGVIDFIAAGIAALLFFHIKRTRQTQLPRVLFSFFCLVMINVTVISNGVTQLFWSYPAMMTVFYLLKPKPAMVLNSIALAPLVLMILGWMSLDKQPTALVTLFATFLVSLVFSISRDKQQQQLTLMATQDPLTGVGNRFALEEKIASSIAQFDRLKMPVSIILIDVDHFKRINDTHGHTVGDQVLVKIAEILEKRIRNTDSLFRFGGEEFIIVSDGAELSGAFKLAEDLREAITCTHLVKGLSLTMSAGVAQFESGQNLDQWIKRADDALYTAKESGRNRVSTANPLP